MQQLNILIRLSIITFLAANLNISAAQHSDTSIYINNTKIDILYPEIEATASILVLPGWNFAQDDICVKSDFCKKAKALGYILIIPDMQKSIYQSQFFPQTRQDRKTLHGIMWLTDTVFPALQQKFNLLKENQKNYLV